MNDPFFIERAGDDDDDDDPVDTSDRAIAATKTMPQIDADEVAEALLTSLSYANSQTERYESAEYAIAHDAGNAGDWIALHTVDYTWIAPTRFTLTIGTQTFTVRVSKTRAALVRRDQ